MVVSSPRDPGAAADLAAPLAPLERVVDEVVEHSFNGGSSVAHIRIWRGPAPEGERVVVLVGELRDGVGITMFIEDIADIVHQRFIERPETAVWFDYHTAGDPGLHKHEVNRIRFHWSQDGVGLPRRTWTASGPWWRSTSVAEVERLVGVLVECYPRHAYTSATVKRWRREGGQLDVVYDTVGLGGAISALRCLDAVDVDDETATTAADARRLLATEVREQLDRLQRGPWEDGTTTRGSETGWPRCFAARNVPPSLSPDDEALLRRYPDPFNWGPWSEVAARDLRPLLGRLQVWRDETGEHADHPDPAVHDAVTRAHRLVRRSIRSRDPEGAAQDFPDTQVRLCAVEGPWDRRYLATVHREANGGDTPRRRALRAQFSGRVQNGLVFGTDPWQHLVAYHGGSGWSPEAFAVEWPLRLASDPVPDDAELVADGAGGDRPVYISLPDGRMALLPADPASTESGTSATEVAARPCWWNASCAFSRCSTGSTERRCRSAGSASRSPSPTRQSCGFSSGTSGAATRPERSPHAGLAGDRRGTLARQLPA